MMRWMPGCSQVDIHSVTMVFELPGSFQQDLRIICSKLFCFMNVLSVKFRDDESKRLAYLGKQWTISDIFLFQKRRQ